MKIILLALASLLSNPLYSAQLGSITAFNEKNTEFEIQTSLAWNNSPDGSIEFTGNMVIDFFYIILNPIPFRLFSFS